MRMILVGAVESTRVALETLCQIKAPLVALVTLPSSKKERHSDYVDLEPLARREGIPIITAPDINEPKILEQLRGINPDYVFVIGWSQICKREFLNIAQKGSIGFHPALLPENRGRAVIPWTILQQRKTTGTTLFWMDEGVDTGDILVQIKFSLDKDETATTLYQKHTYRLQQMLIRTAKALYEGNAPRIPQDHVRATWCNKRTPDDGLIDWNAPAESIWTLVRAVTYPYPGAFTFYKNEKLRIWEASYEEEKIRHGLQGQVQMLSEKGASVQCGDGRCVILKIAQWNNDPPILANILLKKQDRLGRASSSEKTAD